MSNLINPLRADLSLLDDTFLYKVPASGGTHLFTSEDFLNDAECLALQRAAEDHYRPSRIYTPEGFAPDPTRTSRSAFLTEDAADDETVKAVYARLCALVPHPVMTDPMQLHRYHVGQKFEKHYDWLDPIYADKIAEKGQRAWTFIVYLNDDFQGGGTDFPSLGAEVIPKKGMLVGWYNLHVDGSGNDLALHAGLPVEVGSKYLLSLWVRNKLRLDPPAL